MVKKSCGEDFDDHIWTSSILSPDGFCTICGITLEDFHKKKTKIEG